MTFAIGLIVLAIVGFKCLFEYIDASMEQARRKELNKKPIKPNEPEPLKPINRQEYERILAKKHRHEVLHIRESCQAMFYEQEHNIEPREFLSFEEYNERCRKCEEIMNSFRTPERRTYKYTKRPNDTTKK